MKPILFNTEMVKAILEGRKTVTRRKIEKWNGASDTSGFWRNIDENGKTYIKDYNRSSCWQEESHYIRDYAKYQKGDILYVRESFMDHHTYFLHNDLPNPHILYRADYDEEDASLMSCGIDKWKPSIHMPKEYARLFLKVTDVRIERLQDIRYYEIFKEGIKSADVCNSKCHNDLLCAIKQACGVCFVIDVFKTLWNSTIKKTEMDQYGWDANPWVWVYEFEVISKEEAMKEME